MKNKEQIPKFEVYLIHKIEDIYDYNIDVHIYLDDGRRFFATFFTLQNVHTLMENWSLIGECVNGIYFWATDSIIVRELTLENINATIQDLLETDCFFSALTDITETDEEYDNAVITIPLSSLIQIRNRIIWYQRNDPENPILTLLLEELAKRDEQHRNNQNEDNP
jgi:hypothetical protein